MLAVLVILVLAVQGQLLQAHIHPATAPHAVSWDGGPPGHGPVSPGGGAADCPLCQIFQSTGQYFMPLAGLLLAMVLAGLAAVSIPIAVARQPVPVHVGRSRAPPRRRV